MPPNILGSGQITNHASASIANNGSQRLSFPLMLSVLATKDDLFLQETIANSRNKGGRITIER